MNPRGGVYALFICSFLVASFFLISPFHHAQARTRVEVNIFYPGADSSVASLKNFENQLGFSFHSVKWYQDWSENFDPNVARRLHDGGYLPEFTWQPQTTNGGVAFQDVVNGQYDNYINANAQLVRNLGFPIRISLAPEMNADWSPWGVGNNGNNDQNERQFWRHVVQKFRDAGATNVSWIWAPNVEPWNALYSYAQLYPGNDYVDYVGLDGYNWGTSQSWSEWQSFREVYESSYNKLIQVSSKPVLLMEVASAEAGGSKPDWIRDMIQSLDHGFNRIVGFTWFNINKETDWRINSTQASQDSFRAAVLGSTASAPPPGNKANTTVAKTQTSTKNSATSTQNKPTTEPAELTPTVSPTVAPTDILPSVTVAVKQAGSLYSASQQRQWPFNEGGLVILLILISGISFIGAMTLHQHRHLHRATPHPLQGQRLVDSVYYIDQRINNRRLRY